MGEGSPELPGFLGAIDMRRSDLGDGPAWGCWVRLAVPVVAVVVLAGALLHQRHHPDYAIADDFFQGGQSVGGLQDKRRNRTNGGTAERHDDRVAGGFHAIANS
mgnify:CR=1 FL=1